MLLTLKAEWPANCTPEPAQPFHPDPSLTAQAALAKGRFRAGRDGAKPCTPKAAYSQGGKGEENEQRAEKEQDRGFLVDSS